MTVLEQHITHNIWRFDPFSLLLLLNHLGYEMDDISFSSHFTYSSQSRLVESIEFFSSTKKVTITLNMGLLGGQSVLPHYLFKQVDNHTIDEQHFEEFFGYFNDRLIRQFLFSIYSELDQSLNQSWEARKKAAIFTLKIEIISTLHWLFQLVFPELQVRVKKASLSRNVILSSPILGKTPLGYQAVFGKIKKLTVPGNLITLITDEQSFADMQPWPDEIRQRLQQLVFPVLENVGIDLEVWLIIRSQETALSLKKNSYLGYENLLSNQLQSQRIRIFSGYICN